LGIVGEKHGELTARVQNEDREVLAVGEAWLVGEARGDGEDRVVSAVERAARSTSRGDGSAMLEQAVESSGSTRCRRLKGLKRGPRLRTAGESPSKALFA